MSDYVNSTETIVIDSVTKYGGKVNGKSYNLSKKYTGPALEAGKTYSVQISTSPNGAKYINEAKELSGSAVTSSAALTRTTNSGSTHSVNAGIGQSDSPFGNQGRTTQPVADQNPVRVNGSSLSPTEKDTRILVQGVLQAVVQAPIFATADINEFEELVKSTTINLVEFIRNFK